MWWKTKSSTAFARSKGLPWGLPPFGYVPDRTNRTYVISKPEAAMVRTIFQRYSEGGVSQYRIARELNDSGKLRGGAKQWTARQVGRVLDNPAYVGRCVFDGELVPGSWEAIVDDKMWEQARAVREADKRRISLLRAAKGGPYLLSGLLHCGHCGRRLVHRATHGGQRDGIYVCLEPGGKWCPGGSIGCGRADEFVTQRFLDRCRFMIQGREAASFRDSERAWLKSSMQQRRALLSLAIDRVVLVPWPGGDKPRRASPPRREVRIEWVPGTRSRGHVVLVAEELAEAEPLTRVSAGRTEMMRDLEAKKLRAVRDQRSQRARAYYQEWNERRRS
jgi:hypothetical protein